MRQVIALGTTLVLTLALSWSIYTDDGVVRDLSEVAIYADPGDTLASVAWSDEDGDVLVETRVDAKGDYLWVSITEEVEVVSPEGPFGPDMDTDVDSDSDSDSGAQLPREPLTERVTRSFKGNLQASEVWDNFSPLYAIRSLSESVDTTAFGLDDPSATIVVTGAWGTTQLVVGGETFGAKDRYVALADAVFLVDDGDLRPLQYAKTRLVERGLVPFTVREIAQIEVAADGRRAVWTHENRDDRVNDHWAPEGSPDARDDAVKSWMRKLLGVRAHSYEDDETFDVAVEPVLTYTVSGEGTSFQVQILREVVADDDPRWFARSEYTRSLVELTRSLATDAFMDVDVVLP